MAYLKNFRAARANLLRVVKKFWRKTHEKSKIGESPPAGRVAAKIKDILENFPALRAPIC